jgi:class 3 adenylate cyclase
MDSNAMSQTTNRTFICCVVFLDIVEYSRQPDDEQIQLKSRFNELMAEAIKGVAVNDRIILDTGDGAAISFLGDPEDALFVALSIRDAIIGEDSSSRHRLSARIGINLGPVKLVQDINGQRNMIGDGINTAQRVMSFANPGQILVSRSYFEVISRISQEYAKLFQYEGSHADKHVREHQVYSVCPVEKEKVLPPALPVPGKNEQSMEIPCDDVAASATDIDTGGQSGIAVIAEEGQPLQIPRQTYWRFAWKQMLGNWSVKWLDWKKILICWSARWLNWNALRNNRMMLYVAAAVIVILISVPVIVWTTGGKPVKGSETFTSPAPVAMPGSTRKVSTSTIAKKAESPVVTAEHQIKTEAATIPVKPAASATVSLGIAPWGEVYVDGNKKGVAPPLNSLQMMPGKHQIEIRNTTFPPYLQTVELKPGEQLKIKHKFR